MLYQKLLQLALIGFVSFFSIHPVLAQDTSLSKKSMLIDKHKKKGIYRSFIEFQQNNPSYTDTFFTVTRPIVFLGSKHVLKTINAEGKRERIRGRIWGYCNGKDVFIKNLDFDKILYFGYYCVYDRVVYSSSPSMPDANGMFTSGFRYDDTETVILDYTTGVSSVLNKVNLINIVLVKDPELLAEFREEKRRRKLLLVYLLKFNERNESKIVGKGK